MVKTAQNSAGGGISLKEAMHLQALEGNPLDAEQVAMFEMFERENWPEEKRLSHIRQRAAARRHIAAE